MHAEPLHNGQCEHEREAQVRTASRLTRGSSFLAGSARWRSTLQLLLELVASGSARRLLFAPAPLVPVRNAHCTNDLLAVG